MRVAINGFGRIGRSVFRILDKNKDIEVIAINDLSNQESLAYLLKYDTIMGRFSGNVNVEKEYCTQIMNLFKCLVKGIPLNCLGKI